MIKEKKTQQTVIFPKVNKAKDFTLLLFYFASRIMSMFRSFILTLCVISSVIIGVSCNQVEEKKKAIIPAHAIFLDYRAWGEEEGGVVNVRLQFRQGGPEGDAILLEEPASVSWDNTPMQADSSRMNGFYYEKRIPVAEFSNHSILFSDSDGKQYGAEMNFPVFKFVKEIPNQVKRGDFVLELEGLEDREDLQVLLSDTSFYGRGIDRIFTVKNGKLLIPARYMDRLANGPVTLELIREEHRVLQEAPQGGGMLVLTYGVKSEFILLKNGIK